MNEATHYMYSKYATMVAHTSYTVCIPVDIVYRAVADLEGFQWFQLKPPLCLHSISLMHN
jgi:hypothetical protein